MALSEIFNSPQNIASFVGGLIIIVYIVWQAIEKAFSNVGWIKKRREKREQDKLEKSHKETANFVTKVVMPPFMQEIEDINNKQNIKLDKLLRSTNDTMRLELLRVYFHYRPYKQIPQWAKEAAVKLHDDYIAQDGNTFVGDLWNQMSQWEVVPSEEDIVGYRGREEI